MSSDTFKYPTFNDLGKIDELNVSTFVFVGLLTPSLKTVIRLAAVTF